MTKEARHRRADAAGRTGDLQLHSHGLSRAFAVVVSLTGLVVMLGWTLDIDVLKSILPTWVTMKFSTALSFTLSGITLFFISKMVEGKRVWAQVVIPFTTSAILIMMVSLLASTALGVRTGIEDLFVREAEGALMTTTPGRPSVGTMVCFILVEAAGILAIFGPATLAPRLPFLGWSVIALGALPMAGYSIGMPRLYYSVPTLSTAMAFHTALLFILLGAALVLAGRTTPWRSTA